MPRLRHPVIWVPPRADTHYLVQIFSGIARYRNERRTWSLSFSPQEPDVNILDPQVIGIVFWRASPDQISELAHCVPCVQTSNAGPLPDVYAVTADDWMAGRLAADHFLQKGFHRFYYIGPPEAHFSQERLGGLAERLREVYPKENVLSYFYQNHSEMLEPGGLDDFFKDIQTRNPPCALFCADDWWAREVIRESIKYDISIPGDLAVLGVNNEPHICEMAETPISSIELPAEEIGYEAARVLDRLIQKSPPSSLHLRIPVRRVVARASTEISAVPDPVVSKALSLIQSGLSESVDIDQLARECGVSRRVLERRFQEVIHISPYQRLLQFRIEHAKTLLRSTPWPLHRISEECGFTEQKQFSVRFKNMEGVSPLHWRKTHSSS